MKLNSLLTEISVVVFGLAATTSLGLKAELLLGFCFLIIVIMNLTFSYKLELAEALADVK